MKIILNGSNHIIDSNISLADLIQEYNLDADNLAIEKNLSIIPTSEYDSTRINENDSIEIVQFVGGG